MSVAATTPVPAEPPAVAVLSGSEIAALLAHGDALFRKGDLAAARLFYERAADAGDGQSAIRLGETFDPVFLDHAQLRGARGDMGKALAWYRRARDLGAPEAEVLLDRLEAKQE
jgi:TPR repeat protein